MESVHRAYPVIESLEESIDKSYIIIERFLIICF